jgi:hypothetical protein
MSRSDDLRSFLTLVVDVLNRADIPYMLAGSLASSIHGVPRATNDVDLVIDPSTSALDSFVRYLNELDVYIDADLARTELIRRGQFNIIDPQATWKADLIYRKDRAFSRTEFARRVRAAPLGVELYIATAEDTLLAKLEWARLGQSERQILDVVGIIEVSDADLDVAYIESWLDELLVRELWERAVAQRRTT